MEDEEEESVDEGDSSEEVQEETEIPTSWGEATTNME